MYSYLLTCSICIPNGAKGAALCRYPTAAFREQENMFVVFFRYTVEIVSTCNSIYLNLKKEKKNLKVVHILRENSEN
jgi:hypothetical protein